MKNCSILNCPHKMSQPQPLVTVNCVSSLRWRFCVGFFFLRKISEHAFLISAEQQGRWEVTWQGIQPCHVQSSRTRLSGYRKGSDRRNQRLVYMQLSISPSGTRLLDILNTCRRTRIACKMFATVIWMLFTDLSLLLSQAWWVTGIRTKKKNLERRKKKMRDKHTPQ